MRELLLTHEHLHLRPRLLLPLRNMLDYLKLDMHQLQLRLCLRYFSHPKLQP